MAFKRGSACLLGLRKPYGVKRRGLGTTASEFQLPEVFDAIDIGIGEARDGKVAKGGVRNWGDVGFVEAYVDPQAT